MNLWNGFRPNVAATSAVTVLKVKSSIQTTGVAGRSAQSTHMRTAQNVVQGSTPTPEKPYVETVEKKKKTMHNNFTKPAHYSWHPSGALAAIKTNLKAVFKK